MRTVVILTLAAFAAGCSATEGPGRNGSLNPGGSGPGVGGSGGNGFGGGPGGGGPGGGGPGGAGPGGSGFGGSVGGGSGGFDAGGIPAPVTTYPLTIGPVNLQPGVETTFCVYHRVPNPSDVFVAHMSAELSVGSHHLIVYRANGAQENKTPQLCVPFQGIIGGAEAPLLIVQKERDELNFPEGVALKIQPGQVIKLETHFINTTSAALQGQATVHFDTVPIDTPNFIESDLAFWGPTVFTVPPRQATQSAIMFEAGRPNTKGFAMTTHQHRFGTHFKIWYGKSQSDPNAQLLLDNSNWEEPPLYRFNPSLPFDGQSGLFFQCEWNNTTDQFVTFGESALQEMCFLWMYYYPSSGFDIRLRAF